MRSATASALLVLLALTVQAEVAQQALGGGYRGVGFAVAAVFGLRVLATLLFGAVLLGPLSALTATTGPLDRRWTMIGSDAVRLALFVVAPLWIDWLPDSALAWLLVTVFVTGIGRTPVDHRQGRRRPRAAARPGGRRRAPRARPPRRTAPARPAHRLRRPAGRRRRDWSSPPWSTTCSACGIDWFDTAPGRAGVLRRRRTVRRIGGRPVLPRAARRRHPAPALPAGGTAPAQGPRAAPRTAVPARCRSWSSPAPRSPAPIAAAVAVAVLHAADLRRRTGRLRAARPRADRGRRPRHPHRRPRAARAVPPPAARRSPSRSPGSPCCSPDSSRTPPRVLLLALLAGYAAGVAANTGHLLIEQEAEDPRQARTTDHLHAVARAAIGVAAVAAPLVAAAIGPHRVVDGSLHLRPRRCRLHPDAGRRAAAAGRRAGARQDRRPPAAYRCAATCARRCAAATRPSHRRPPASSSPSRAATAPASPPRSRRSPSGSAAKGHEVVVTREPGATAVGKRLRSILLDVSSTGISHRAEALLYAADRAEHVDSVVRPALERGAVVISDRYIDSSVAYQGAGRDLAPTEIARISRWATDGLVPHLTVLLDVVAGRPPGSGSPRRPTGWSPSPPSSTQRVRAGFLTLAAADPARYLVIDAAQEPEAVTTRRTAPARPDAPAVRARRSRPAPRPSARRPRSARRRAEEEAARKAEAERLERERQEQLAKLRAEEEERKRLAEEAAAARGGRAQGRGGPAARRGGAPGRGGRAPPRRGGARPPRGRGAEPPGGGGAHPRRGAGAAAPAGGGAGPAARRGRGAPPGAAAQGRGGAAARRSAAVRRPGWRPSRLAAAPSPRLRRLPRAVTRRPGTIETPQPETALRHAGPTTSPGPWRRRVPPTLRRDDTRTIEVPHAPDADETSVLPRTPDTDAAPPPRNGPRSAPRCCPGSAEDRSGPRQDPPRDDTAGRPGAALAVPRRGATAARRSPRPSAPASCRRCSSRPPTRQPTRRPPSAGGRVPAGPRRPRWTTCRRSPTNCSARTTGSTRYGDRPRRDDGSGRR